MNFFFGLSFENFNSTLTIPKFYTSGELTNQNTVFSAEIDNEEWLIKKVVCNENDNFFYINHNKKKNNIYFLSTEELLNGKKSLTCKTLKKFCKVKDEFVSFRANLKLTKDNSIFSSYQSDYPLELANKNGSVLTPIFPFLNYDCKNFVILKQIFYKPIKENFKAYIIDIKNNEIVSEHRFESNSSNILELNKNKFNENYCLYTEKFLGIPIFVSYGSKKNDISIEHSHPPHLYITSDNKFKVISDLKLRVKNIVH